MSQCRFADGYSPYVRDRQALVLSAAGAGAGVIGAELLIRTLRGLVAGVERTSAGSMALTALGLVTAALMASYMPARRATRIDPIRSLHSE